jgi:hypothetical protein
VNQIQVIHELINFKKYSSENNKFVCTFIFLYQIFFAKAIYNNKFSSKVGSQPEKVILLNHSL